jgi:phage terminase small subunit
MKGRKPNLKVVSGPQPADLQAPAWLPGEAKAEWAVAVTDLAGRGLLFKGALATLASYCLCIAAIRQRQVVLEGDPGDRQTFQDQLKAIALAKQLAVELGLTVTSRSRAFTSQSTAGPGDDFEALVG